MEIHQFDLRIFGEVEHHRTGTAFAGNIKSAGHGPWNFGSRTYLIAPFGNRLGNAHHVGFLKCISSQKRGNHLSANNYHRRTVDHGIGHACNNVGSSRP
jgi:hypothetical protein